jgi:predicted Zn finger-like uncharacterized protein
VYTRCTGCHTTHPVNASLLARGGGKYRCGKCNKVCNALDELFDEWPAAGERPPRAGDLPVLGLSIDLEQARKSRLNPDDGSLTGEPELPPTKTRKRLARLSWIFIAVVVVVIISVEYADFQEKPLSGSPFVQSIMTRLGLLDPPAKPVFRDLDKIHLVSRELKSHPFKAGTLQLTATIVNRARRAQPYPELEVLLLDPGGDTVSNIRFTPSDYLSIGMAKNSRMTPGAYLPLVLELPDPGNQAVGFELKYH